MFAELAADMKRVGWDKTGGVAATEALWKKEFRERKIIAEFMKDATLGDKRLASMPDRTTNTILTADGVVYRPTVINCYQGDLGTIRKWWEQWRRFIFSTTIKMGSNEASASNKEISSLLIPIKRAKLSPSFLRASLRSLTWWRLQVPCTVKRRRRDQYSTADHGGGDF